IGVVGGNPALGTVAERVAGWADGLSKAGLRPDDAVLRLGVRDEAAASAVTASLLGTATAPTAMLALSERLAPGVVMAAAAAAAPVVVAVFGRVPLAALLRVPVWSIDYDAAELGRRGAELLLDRLDGNAGPARRIVVPTTLRQDPLTFTSR